MQQEKWWGKYLTRLAASNYVPCADAIDVQTILQEHTKRIIKEIEGMKVIGHALVDIKKDEVGWVRIELNNTDRAWNAALDAVINHLKK